MKRYSWPLTGDFDSQLLRAFGSDGRLFREGFYGKPGDVQAMTHAQRTGTHVSQRVTIDGLDGEMQAVCDALAIEMKTPGNTVTVNFWEVVGGVRGKLLMGGTVDTGPATIKGVTVDPPNPMHAMPSQAGEVEVEIITTNPLRYGGVVKG